MAKLNKIILFMGIIILFFHFAGLLTDTPARQLLDLLLHPENIASTTFIAKMLGITTAITAAGIAIGAFITGKTEIALKAPIFLFFVELIYGWWGVMLKLKEVNNAFAIIFGAPLMLCAIIAAIDWLFGRD